jgi:hypothetical protein
LGGRVATGLLLGLEVMEVVGVDLDIGGQMGLRAVDVVVGVEGRELRPTGEEVDVIMDCYKVLVELD